MKISLNWIKDYVSINLTPEELKKQMSLSLAEVEKIEQFGERYKDIIVAEVLDVKEHPKSKELLVLSLNIGNNQKRQVVVQQCPVKKNDKVAFIKPGLIIPETFELGDDCKKVEESKIRGVKSEGVIPSGREIGLNNDHTTVYTLPSDAKNGQPIAQVLDLVDYILEIENKALTHRPDTFSIIGIAREIYALQQNAEFEEPKWLIEEATSINDDIVEKFDLEIKNEVESLCNRYMAVVIDNVKIKPSPKWLQIRLVKMGVRPVNNVVDITNYLMLEAGQPSHAFDYDKVVSRDKEVEDKAVIKVRLAHPDEKITTLDGQQKQLYDDTVVIADSKSPIGIAGVMGGKDTEISEQTRTIIFQVENLDMYSVRRTSMKTGLFTDAVTRFSKGLDPNLCEPVIKKGIEMITELTGGQVASELLDIYTNPRKKRFIKISTEQIKQRIGRENVLENLTDEKIIEIIEKLGLKVREEVELTKDEEKQGVLSLEIPTRRPDLNIWEDIFEEIVRIYGYDKLQPTLNPLYNYPSSENTSRAHRMRIKHLLKSAGANEIYTYSFVSQELYDNLDMSLDKAHKLRNPLSPELTFMRPLLLPSILQNVPKNTDDRDNFALFEIDLVNPLKKGKQTELPDEPWHLGLIHTESYYHAKKYLDYLMDRLFIKDYRIIPYSQISEKKLSAWIRNSLSQYHPSRLGYIEIKNNVVGVVGQIDSDSVRQLDLPSEISGFEINIDEIENYINELPNYQEPSSFPTVVQDFCFEVDKDLPYVPLQRSVKLADKDREEKVIKNIECIDIYVKDSKTDEAASQQSSNKKSSNKQPIKRVTLRVTFQSSKKTLDEEDITAIRKSILQSVKKRTGGQLAQDE